MSEKELIVPGKVEVKADDNVSFFSGIASFEEGQRMAQLLSASTIVPKDFQKNIANTLIALEMAIRINASPLAVMQSLYIVHGKPGWSGQFIIAAVNSSGRFRGQLRLELTGEGDNRQCVAWAMSHDGERLEGAPVSIRMAKDEGWFSKSGSKWKTMPELMLRYRAATFFGREYSPDLLMGMHTTEEIHDTVTPVARPAASDNQESTEVSLNDVIEADMDNKIPPGPQASDISDNITEYKSAIVSGYKAAIDKLETSLKVDQWRERMSKEIIKMSQADQDAVFSYADDAFEALKQSE